MQTLKGWQDYSKRNKMKAETRLGRVTEFEQAMAYLNDIEYTIR